MVAQSEERRLALECPAVVRRGVWDDRLRLVEPLRRHDDLGRSDAREFVLELVEGRKLGHFEIAGRQVDQRQTKSRTNCRHEVVSFSVEDVGVEVGAGGENLRHVALDQFARFGFFELVADGDLLAVLEEFADVAFGGVMRNAAHGRAVAGGECEVEQPSSSLGVVEKHFVEIAEPEQ